MLQKFMIGALMLLFSAAVFAQTDDFHKSEVFDDFFDNRQSFNGVTVSGVGNFSRYVGVRGDFSANFKKYRFDLPTFGTTTTNTDNQGRVNASLYNFLGGVQVKDNSIDGSRFRPFGYALAGVAHSRSKLDNSFFSTSFCRQTGVDCRREFGESNTGFAAAFGGGIDIKATNRFSFRAVQVDYNPTHINRRTQDNLRFGFGVVVH